MPFPPPRRLYWDPSNPTLPFNYDGLLKLIKKIDKDMDGYKILGACNPNMAWEAMGLEPRIGAMLPCNVILRSVEGGTEVSAIDPVASMQAVDNAALHKVAGEVRDMLVRAVEAA